LRKDLHWFFNFQNFFQKKVKKNFQGKLLAQNFGELGARRSGKLRFGSLPLGHMARGTQSEVVKNFC
jgi:hypothetical protein